MDSAPELNMTPQETVDALDRYIIGQTDAKKAVAVALRNRWRRLQLDEDLKDEILPKNIIMIGPTGIGKTEIARRISRLVNAPFVKVEASKFTEVGYVGRDVESMIRDLTDYSVNMVRQEQMERKQEAAKEMVEERLLDLLLPPLESEKDAYERMRLMYVGTTRPMQKLVLIGHIEQDKCGESITRASLKKPPRNSMLSVIWESVEDDFYKLAKESEKVEKDEGDTVEEPHRYRRVSNAYIPTLLPDLN